MKNIIIVEATSTGRFYVQEAAQRGIHPIVIYPKLECDGDEYRPFRQAAAEFSKRYTQDIYFLDTEDFTEILELVRPFSPIAVIAGSELGVALADALSKELNLPGNDPATSLARRNKFSMNQALKDAGVPCIRSVCVSDISECLDTIRQWNTFPIVLKPLAGAGSQGVHFCATESEVIEKFAEILSMRDLFGNTNTKVLVQEFARGTEFIVNTVSHQGRHYLTDLWEYNKIAIGNLGNAYDYAKLVRTFQPKHQEVIDYAMQVLSALGFQYGPSHTEIMLTDRGPLLIETGARPMGGFFPKEVLEQALHHHIVDVSLDSYIDPERFQLFKYRPYTTYGSVMLKLFIAPRAMKLQSLPILTLKRFLTSAGVSDFSFAHEKLAIPQTVNLITASGELILTHNREAIVMRDYHALRQMEMENFELLFSEKAVAIDDFKLRLNHQPYSVQSCQNWEDVIEQFGQLTLQSAYGDELEVKTRNLEFKKNLCLLLRALGWCMIGNSMFRNIRECS